ncbi:DUF2945 domain-containing protein [Citricoccus sp. GCM10030269]|uniref:DUF2945 domain-containing protein n=1 Tax=Citricoccus sp. GCM10030269 TaxID=3273388 RepID=UPI00361C40FE
MTQRFSVGDRVMWMSEAGEVSGRITRAHTADFDYNGHIREASEDHPQYEVVSDATGHEAAHRGECLTRIDD